MGVYTVNNINTSLLDEEGQRLLYAILTRHKVFFSQTTSSGRLKVFNLSTKQFNALRQDISRQFPIKPSLGVTYVQSCMGTRQCRYAIKDALALGMAIEKLHFSKPFPHKVKVAVAGCRMCCTEPYVRDIGLIAEKQGWKVIFGGNAGGRPRIGDVLREGLDTPQAIELVKKSLNYYLHNAGKKQRTARFVEIHGIENFKKNVL